MRFVVCHTCKSAVQIGGEPQEVMGLLGATENFPCITPLCSGRMAATAPAKIPPGYSFNEVPIRGFFRAINGFGPGTGDPASFARLKELLLSQRVVEIRGEPIGTPQRVILRELVLEGGARLHFETSAKGACVYYIEEPGPSCVEVVENELAAAASEGHDPGREETGRAPQTEPVSGKSPEGPVDQPGAPELPNSERLPPVPEAGDVPAGVVPGYPDFGTDPRVRM